MNTYIAPCISDEEKEHDFQQSATDQIETLGLTVTAEKIIQVHAFVSIK